MAYHIDSEYARAKAKQNLVHYFRLVAEKQGIRWDSDNDAEIEDIVDWIIEAARPEPVPQNGKGRAK